MDFVKWATIKRLDECRFIAAVVRVVVKAVVLSAVVAAVVTVAEVKDKTVIGHDRNHMCLRSMNSDIHDSINSSNNIFSNARRISSSHIPMQVAGRIMHWKDQCKAVGE